MQNEQREKLKKVCSDVFEQLAFMFGEVIEKDEVESDAEEFLRASMTFSGNRSGSIEIIIPRELSPHIAANILGADENERQDALSYEDALKELLNTICGRMLTALFGEEAVFNLHVPETHLLSIRQWNELLEEKDFIAFDIDDNPVLVHAAW
jgi:hypothetical protein